MTAKEKAFAEEYVVNGYNATQAYLKAYNTDNYTTANSEGHKVLKKAHVKEYVQELQKAQFEAACITAERIGIKLAEIAFCGKGDQDYNATAQLKALDLLQKQLGIQKTKQEIDANVNQEINIIIEE